MVTARGGRSRGAGFTLLEIVVGLAVLGVVLVGLTAYVGSQRRSLHVANQLADGTRAASSALETLKGRLADSAYFRQAYDDAKHRPRVSVQNLDVNNRPYTVTVTLVRAPGDLYALKARARAAWNRDHGMELGVLCPGPSDAL